LKPQIKQLKPHSSILTFKNDLENKTINKLGKRIPNAKALLQYLYLKPVITVADIMKELSNQANGSQIDSGF
jgi:hypothetical protein